MIDSNTLQALIANLPAEERVRTLALLELLEKTRDIEQAQQHFIPYVKRLWPTFIQGTHHKLVAEQFEDILSGKQRRVIVAMPPRHCIASGQKVLTYKRGWVNIDRLKIGDRVYSWKDGHCVPGTITARPFQGTDAILRISTGIEEIRVNAQHPFLIKEDGETKWRQAKDLKKGDNLVLVHDVFEPFGYIQRVGDYRIEVHGYRGLGMLFGCAVPYRVKGKVGGFEVYRINDEQVAALYPIMGELFGKEFDPGKRKFYCAPEGRYLESIGIKSQLDEFPTWVYRLPRWNKRAFLDGYLSVRGAKAAVGYTYQTTNRQMFRAVVRLARMCGVKVDFTYISKTNPGGIFIFTRTWHDQKIDSQRQRWIGKNWRTSPIRSIHPDGRDKIWDLTIDDSGTFICEGFVVHNTKSEFASVYLPSWFLGRFPHKKVIQASNTAELAVGFGRRVRNIIDSDDFQEIFPGVSLAADSKAAGRWNTNKGGEYFAIGAGGTVSGKGADLFIIDDPHSEQEAVLAQSNPGIFDSVLEWYESGPRQRLQPNGSIVIVATRWSLRDLTGQLIKKQMNDLGADKWEVISLPAILDSGNPLWPEFWRLEELLATKASIPVSKWNAQYQQNPTSEEGALIKREWWVDWPHEEAPHCEAIIQSWDTAFTAKTRSDYSACTTWGVFYKNNAKGKKQYCLILLDMLRGKWEFPELKERALQHYKFHEPDICLIEARASGMPLIFEMRAMGLPVQDVVVGRSGGSGPNDKISRVNTVVDIFASGMVYVNKSKHWAQEVMEECAAFPSGEHDDIVDTVVYALQRFRQGGWVGTKYDVEDDDERQPRRKAAYY